MEYNKKPISAMRELAAVDAESSVQMRMELDNLRKMIDGDPFEKLADWIRNKPVLQSVNEYMMLRYNLQYNLEEYFHALMKWHAEKKTNRLAIEKNILAESRGNVDPLVLLKLIGEKTNLNNKNKFVQHYNDQWDKFAAAKKANDLEGCICSL